MSSNERKIETLDNRQGDKAHVDGAITNHKDSASATREQARMGLKAFRLTNDEGNAFTIDMGNGSKIQDKRPLCTRAHPGDLIADSFKEHSTLSSDRSHQHSPEKSPEHTTVAERKLVDLGGGAKADEVTPSNCCEQTKKLWETMSQYPGQPFNCFSSVMEYVAPGGLPTTFCIPGELRLALKTHGWKQHQDLNLDSGGHKAGEVIMVTDANHHTHTAIVSKVENGHIIELEQKPNDTDPPIKTPLKQFKDLYKPNHTEVYQKDQ